MELGDLRMPPGDELPYETHRTVAVEREVAAHGSDASRGVPSAAQIAA